MHDQELPTMGLRGSYRDVLYDEAGRVTGDTGWQKNTIVLDCRRLLAAFMNTEGNTSGIQGMLVGKGDPSWDLNPSGPPPAVPSGVITDPLPYLVPPGSLALSYIVPGTINTPSPQNTPTNVLQIVATLGVNQPPWPHLPDHADGTLREFGLVAQLTGNQVLVNLVHHVAIPKDSQNTLVRTIQLVF